MLRIYYAATAVLAEVSLFRRGYELMPTERRRKINQIKPETGKRLSLGAGLLLRKICRDFRIDGADEEIAYGPRGKPYFATQPQLYFNLSHSGNRVLAAVADREVGCDVEAVGTGNLQVARRFFAPAEYETICRETDAEKQNELFYRFWTVKESFLKCGGKGFALPLCAFTVDLSAGTVTFQDGAFSGEYAFTEFDFADGYRYACCITGSDQQREPAQINSVDLKALLLSF